MRLLRLLVPILFSIILIVLDTRFSYLDNFKRFTLTLLSPIYFVVDLPNHVIDWVNDKGTDNAELISENEYYDKIRFRVIPITLLISIIVSVILILL